MLVCSVQAECRQSAGSRQAVFNGGMWGAPPQQAVFNGGMWGAPPQQAVGRQSAAGGMWGAPPQQAECSRGYVGHPHSRQSATGV